MKTFFLSLAILLISNATYAQVELPNTISKSDKVYGLSKFWQEVNYNFVYLYKHDKTALENEYRRLIDEVQETNNDYEYYRLLEKFCASLNDGHTDINYPEKVKKCITNAFGEYVFHVENIDNRAIITRICVDKKDEIPIGSEVIEVNGMPTQQYLNEYVKPYVCSSTDHVRDNITTMRIFDAPLGTKFKIKIRKVDTNTDIVLNLINEYPENWDLYPDQKQKPRLEYKELDNDITYLALNAFWDPKIIDLFDEKLPELKKAKRLIIDLRANGGGSDGTANHILCYLTQDSLITTYKSRTRKHLPAYKAWAGDIQPSDTINLSSDEREWCRDLVFISKDSLFHEFSSNSGKNPIPQEERIVVPTVVLIGTYTASAAENFLIKVDNQPHFIKIGERSCGSTGQPLFMDLPGEGSARICTKDDTYPDGRAFVGVGVIPDILVKRTVTDFLNNKDVVLDRAIEYLKEK